MENKLVSEGLFVEIEYILSENDPQGEVLEECPAENAFGFFVGEGEVLDSLEKVLIGKKPGEPFEVTIPCAEAYGETTEDAIVKIPKDVFEVDGNFDEEHVKVGEAVPMSDDEGNELWGIVVEVSEDVIIMDFNHPFADLDLHFEGRICDVREENN